MIGNLCHSETFEDIAKQIETLEVDEQYILSVHNFRDE